MRQILYVSTSTQPGDSADLVGILRQSRHNNAIDGVTGVLWSDGARFLQVIEGPPDSILGTWGRICTDARHREITVLHDVEVNPRAFGDWWMIHRRANEPADIYDAQMRRLLGHTTDAIRQPFLSLIATGDVS